MTDEVLLRNIELATSKILKEDDLEGRFRTSVIEASRVLGAEHGSIFLCDGDEFRRAYTNVPARKRTEPRKKGYVYKTFRSGKAHLIDAKALQKIHKAMYDQGVRSVILIPLKNENEKIGVLALQSPHDHSLPKMKLEILSLFGNIITLSIQSAQALRTAKQSISDRDLFISLASHELRTPLTTISVYIDKIARKVHSKQMPSEATIEILQSETERLKNIINELLDFDQIVTGQFNYKWRSLNIHEIIRRSVINFKAQYSDYKVIIQNDISRGDGMIQGDAEKLQQAFANIMNNAAKFSSSFTPILITLSNDGDNTSVTFSDYGRGIKKREQQKIFSEFYKGEDNRSAGMGLGLYLVKKIIGKHNGSISVYSKLHKGTVLTVKLPNKLYD